MKQLSLLAVGTLATLLFLQETKAQNTAYGSGALASNTTGPYNSAFGFKALYSNTTGGYNTAMGYALYSNTSGHNNVAIGHAALFYNTSGYHNTALGSGALTDNTTGYQNVAVGMYALQNNTIGFYNTAQGAYAGFSNTSGSSNSFLGHEAGYTNTTGSNNSFLGQSAGHANTSGSYNSFIGAFAGPSNTTGNFNSFVGYNTGYFNTTGSYNTFLGYTAGSSNSTGYNNCFLGSYAGSSNTSGINNSFVGYYAGLSNTTGNENVFIGMQSGRKNASGSANTYLGTYAGTVAAGTSNTMLGKGSGYRTTTGSNNTFVGRDAGGGNVTGSGNTFVGYRTSMPSTLTGLSNATAIGYMASVAASNSLVLGSINGVNGATADTKVGIKTTAPAYNLHVNGTAAKPGGGSWTVASDKRLKQEIEPYKEGLEKVMQIEPVWFRYNGKAGLPTEQKYVGIIAQQMQKIAPYTIGNFTYQDAAGKKETYLDYDPNALTYMLVNAIQEQQKQITELKDLVQKLVSGQPTINVPTVSGFLEQNTPNPPNDLTTIRYYVADNTRSAVLNISDAKGQLVKTINLNRGSDQIHLNTSVLAAGTYSYALYIEGSLVDVKRLVIVR